MRGYLLLEGGAEFGGQMAEPDLRAIQLAGGMQARIGVIPAAAAPDHNDQRAGRNALRWFAGLGARQAQVIALIDRPSANQPEITAALRLCRLIYILGGFPDYLCRTLAGSSAWEAVLQAYGSGAVIGGSSAGAMVLCRHYYDPEQGRVAPGLDLLHNSCVIPHHDTFGRDWAPRLAVLLPGVLLVGIDERTGMIDDGAGGDWTVYGQGSVTLYLEGKVVAEHQRGEAFSMRACTG